MVLQEMVLQHCCHFIEIAQVTAQVTSGIGTLPSREIL